MDSTTQPASATVVLFVRTELDNIPPNQLPATSLIIKQRFDYRFNAYNQMRAWFPVNPVDAWRQFNDALNRFQQTSLNPWNQKWNQINNNQDKNVVANYFEEGVRLFQPIEDLVAKYFQPFPFPESDHIRQFKEATLKEVRDELLGMKSELLTEFNKGINSLVQLKSELQLTGNFSDNISSQLKTAKAKSRSFFIWFIISLVVLAALLLLPFAIPSVEAMPWYFQLAVRLSIVFPIGFICHFLFNHYKFYKLAEIKYSHLNSFLGGGATHLTQLIQGNDQLKNEAFQKLSDMFLRIDDLMHAIDFKADPSTKTIKRVVELVAEVNKTLAQVRPK